MKVSYKIKGKMAFSGRPELSLLLKYYRKLICKGHISKQSISEMMKVILDEKNLSFNKKWLAKIMVNINKSGNEE